MNQFINKLAVLFAAIALVSCGAADDAAHNPNAKFGDDIGTNVSLDDILQDPEGNDGAVPLLAPKAKFSAYMDCGTGQTESERDYRTRVFISNARELAEAGVDVDEQVNTVNSALYTGDGLADVDRRMLRDEAYEQNELERVFRSAARRSLDFEYIFINDMSLVMRIAIANAKGEVITNVLLAEGDGLEVATSCFEGFTRVDTVDESALLDGGSIELGGSLEAPISSDSSDTLSR